MTILIILSIIVFFLAALVFGVNSVNWWKKDIAMSLGFMFSFAYSALSFAIQVNGFISCNARGILEKCIEYPQGNQLPIVRVGFDMVSPGMQSLLATVLTLAVIFFLIYVFKQQSRGISKKHTHHKNS